MKTEDVANIIAKHIRENAPIEGACSVNPSAESVLLSLAEELGIQSEVQNKLKDLKLSNSALPTINHWEEWGVKFKSALSKTTLITVLKNLDVDSYLNFKLMNSYDIIKLTENSFLIKVFKTKNDAEVFCKELSQSGIETIVELIWSSA